MRIHTYIHLFRQCLLKLNIPFFIYLFLVEDTPFSFLLQYQLYYNTLITFVQDRNRFYLHESDAGRTE